MLLARSLAPLSRRPRRSLKYLSIDYGTILTLGLLFYLLPRIKSACTKLMRALTNALCPQNDEKKRRVSTRTHELLDTVASDGQPSTRVATYMTSLPCISLISRVRARLLSLLQAAS